MKTIENQLNILDNIIIEAIKTAPDEIYNNIKDFLLTKSKKLRPTLIFFVANAMKIECSEKILNLAAAVEIIHNATLIHDDIIDNAKIRRGKVSLNIQLGNNLSVLTGDLLLSFAMQLLAKLNNIEIIELFSSALNKMCTGEIIQNSNLYKIPDLDKYIEKSQNKTAELFAAALESLCILENIQERSFIRNFAINFGIAFQIKDDLDNILCTDSTKPFMSDIQNGIYNAPVIFMHNSKDITAQNIENIIQNNNFAVEETKKLIQKYKDTALQSINFIENNQAKQELIKLTENLF